MAKKTKKDIVKEVTIENTEVAKEEVVEKVEEAKVEVAEPKEKEPEKKPEKTIEETIAGNAKAREAMADLWKARQGGNSMGTDTFALSINSIL